MDISLSTQLDATMTRKGLEAQKLEGQNVLALIAAATPEAFTDPALGSRVDIKA